MKRRTTLALMALAPSLLMTSRVFATSRQDTKLLVVFMRGAYDANSLLVPSHTDFYYEVRPTIAIPKASLAKTPMPDGWALSPGVAPILMPYFEKKQLSFIPFSGDPNNRRSHFETQTHVELGLGDRSNSADSGFLNRLASVLSDRKLKAVSFTGNLPLILQGKESVPNVNLRTGITQQGLNSRQRAQIAAMYSGHPLERDMNAGLKLLDDVETVISNEQQAAAGGNQSAERLQREARRVGELMKDEFDIGFIDIGGWDTHVRQGAADGQLMRKLESLATSLDTFAKTMEASWKKTVVVVISEFGRTFRENGTGGTDHGHGTTYWLLGGAVNGGQILGERTTISADKLNDNRDLPVLNDYRSVFSRIFQQLYQLSAKDIDFVLPGARPGKFDYTT